MRFYNIFPEEQLKWMHENFKKNVVIQNINVDQRDHNKINFINEYVNWNKYDFKQDAIADKRTLTNPQINQINQLISNPEWQEYISSQASADFFYEKKTEVKNDMQKFAQREIELQDKLNRPNPFIKNRNFFQRHFSVFRFKENKYYNDTRREMFFVQKLQNNASLLNNRLEEELISIGQKACDFERKHENEILAIFPRNQQGFSSAIKDGEAQRGVINYDILEQIKQNRQVGTPQNTVISVPLTSVYPQQQAATVIAPAPTFVPVSNGQ